MKISYKNKKVIKPIEFHDIGHRVIKVDPIWYHLKIKNNYRFKVFLKKLCHVFTDHLSCL